LATVKVGAGKPSRLIVFDVEGVLLPERRYLLSAAAKRLGPWGFLKVIVIGFLYMIGLLSIESTLKRVFRLFRGLTVDDLFQIYDGFPLMPNAKEVFSKLNESGYKTALISSGLPTLFVEDLAAKLRADYAFGLELGVSNGRLTGEIWGDVIKPDGKALVLKKILENEGASSQDCVVVANDRNNLPMFPLCAVKVGYNPDFLLCAKSDFVVKGELSEILPFVTGSTRKGPRPVFSRSEAIRETIHIGGILVPLFCMYLLEYHIAAILVLLFTLFYIASEITRLKGINFPILHAITRKAAITPELHEFALDPISFALGIFFSLILFPVPINYASIAILTLGDSAAIIFGKKFGRTIFPFNKGKRMEGTIFGFFFAFVGALIFVNDPVKALVGAAVGMLAECLPLPVSDNLTIPLASGLAMTMIP